MIKRDPNKIPKPGLNPAGKLIEDTIEHYNLTQSEVAESMGVAKSALNEVIKGKRGVSSDLAMRAQAYFGLDAHFLLRLQAAHDYYKAYHEKKDEIEKSVTRLECA